jgi:Na+/alanine symporter
VHTAEHDQAEDHGHAQLEGLGRNWRWLAVAYAAATVFATVITGPQIQANAVTAATTETS